MTLAQYGCFIDGVWGAAGSGEMLDVLDPATGEPIARIARGQAGEVDAAVQSARRALRGWAECPPVQRARILAEIARRITLEQDHLARLECQDTGKPLKQAQADAVAAARFLNTTRGWQTRCSEPRSPWGRSILISPCANPWG
ncbi:aldehyde dehydrogenase family protein [Bordetella holmesii ATCC 51541]|nr:aldehyde dehydrogenase family protein [Bordetella holmesii ATCC 51541]